MQDTTIKSFEKTLSKKKFAYDQRLKNDAEEEHKEKQKHEEKRKDEEEKAKLDQLEKKREIDSITAGTKRLASEWAAKTEAMVASINAETEMKY